MLNTVQSYNHRRGARGPQNSLGSLYKPHSAWRTTVNSLPLPVAVNYGHLTPSRV